MMVAIEESISNVVMQDLSVTTKLSNMVIAYATYSNQSQTWQ
jgi:hypothetical protein